MLQSRQWKVSQIVRSTYLHVKKEKLQLKFLKLLKNLKMQTGLEKIMWSWIALLSPLALHEIFILRALDLVLQQD